MTVPDGSPGGDVETDATFHMLETAAQRSAALRIKRLAGEFPWEIVNFCTETKWDIKLLDKFAALIHTCFPGQLSSLDTRRLRSAILGQIEPKAINKRTNLLQSDLQAAQNELRRAIMKENQRHNHHGPSTQGSTTMPKTTDKRKKRTVSTSKPSEPASSKRVRLEPESPRAVMTRSSRRLRGDTIDTTPHTPKATIDGNSTKDEGSFEVAVTVKGNGNEPEKMPEDENTPVKDQINDIKNQEATEYPGVEAVDHSEGSPVDDHGKVAPNEYHGVEDLILDSCPPSQTSGDPSPLPEVLSNPRSSATARKALVAQLSMTDKEIGDRFRKNISFIASKLQFVNNKKMKALETEYERCQREYRTAYEVVEKLGRQLQEVHALHEQAKEELAKASFRQEKTAAALVPYRELQAAEGSVTQIFELLQNAVDEADTAYQKALNTYASVSNHFETIKQELEEAKKPFEAARTKLEESAQLKVNFEQNQSTERRFQCSIRMVTNVRDEDGHLFEDFTFDLESLVRQRDSG
ncbi:hypothetical protein ACLX1H_000990 [Fusarium chlamydosporum]